MDRDERTEGDRAAVALLQDEVKQEEGYKLIVELAGGIDYGNN